MYYSINLNKEGCLMFKNMTYKEIEESEGYEDYIFVDLRSEFEFNDATIPGSINIPIFNDEERKLVGTSYKQEDAEKAKILGLEIVGRKLPHIYREISRLSENEEQLVFFCARGGYRSSSIVSLLSSIGRDPIKLEGGYKAYRNYVLEMLPEIVEDVQFVVLYGNTGTGKTEILKQLKNQGADILDLEGAANHRGSTLGSVGLGEQNSQKMFESLVYHSLKNRRGKLVFTEGESKRIGKNVIPDCIFDKIKSGIHLSITCPLDYRVETIFKDYVHGTDEELIEAITCLKKRIGKSKVDDYITKIKNNKYREVIEDLMVAYYDPLYEKNTRNFVKSFHNEDHLQTAKNILDYIDNQN